MENDVDVFAEVSYGKLALQRIAPTHPDFRLFYAGYLGNKNERDVMKVTGAVFRRALRGKNAGKLSIMVPGTTQTIYLTSKEIEEFAQANPDRAD